MRMDSICPVEVGAMKNSSSIEEESKSAPEPIPDPTISVGVGRTLLVSVVMLLVSSVEVKAIIGEDGIDRLG